MPEKRWKAEERRVARLLGAKRNPHDGSGYPDAENEWLVIENKDRSRPPFWIFRALGLARQKAGPKRLGIVTITSRNDPRVLVVMDIRDFKSWHGWKRRQEEAIP